MNRNIVKYLGGIATVLMVLSFFSTGAFAFAQDRGMNEEDGMMRGMGGPAMNEGELQGEGNAQMMGEMQGNGMKMGHSDMFAMAGNGLLVLSEDIFEDLTFEEAQEMMLEHIDNGVERLNLAGDRLDNDGRSPLTEDEIAEKIALLEALSEEVSAAEDKEDLESVCFSLARDTLEASLDQKIDRLNIGLERLESGDSCPLTEEELNEKIASLEALKDDVAAAEDKEDLDAIKDELKDLAGGPGNGMDKGPDGERGMDRGSGMDMSKGHRGNFGGNAEMDG